MRPRLTYTTWPRPAIHLTDTPRPSCAGCRGHGWHVHDYSGPDGEYGGTEGLPCDCWTPSRTWQLLPVPRWAVAALQKRQGAGTHSCRSDPATETGPAAAACSGPS